MERSRRCERPERWDAGRRRALGAPGKGRCRSPGGVGAPGEPGSGSTDGSGARESSHDGWRAPFPAPGKVPFSDGSWPADSRARLVPSVVHGHYLALRWTRYRVRENAYRHLDRVEWAALVPRVLSWVERAQRAGETWEAALDRVVLSALTAFFKKPGKRSEEYPKGFLIEKAHPLERLTGDLEWVEGRIAEQLDPRGFDATPAQQTPRRELEPVDPQELGEILEQVRQAARAA